MTYLAQFPQAKRAIPKVWGGEYGDEKEMRNCNTLFYTISHLVSLDTKCLETKDVWNLLINKVLFQARISALEERPTVGVASDFIVAVPNDLMKPKVREE